MMLKNSKTSGKKVVCCTFRLLIYDLFQFKLKWLAHMKSFLEILVEISSCRTQFGKGVNYNWTVSERFLIDLFISLWQENSFSVRFQCCLFLRESLNHFYL